VGGGREGTQSTSGKLKKNILRATTQLEIYFIVILHSPLICSIEGLLLFFPYFHGHMVSGLFLDPHQILHFLVNWPPIALWIGGRFYSGIGRRIRLGIG